MFLRDKKTSPNGTNTGQFGVVRQLTCSLCDLLRTYDKSEYAKCLRFYKRGILAQSDFYSSGEPAIISSYIKHKKTALHDF
jgi:hypothetical protein